MNIPTITNKYINIVTKLEQENTLIYIKNYNVFLTGLPGSGKTHITRQYIKYCNSNNIKMGVTASTGIASKLLEVGDSMTIHSWSGIDIVEQNDTFETILNRVIKKPTHVKRWKETSVLIIDEISLLDSKIFTFLDMIGQHLRGNILPFGGIRLLVVGDFYQLPPVKGMFCFESDVWNTIFDININLKTSYRSSDNNINKILSTIRKGKKLKPNMILALKRRNNKKMIKYPIMVPLRDMARTINNNMMLENNNKMFTSMASYSNNVMKNTIMKNTIIKLSPLEDELHFKVGCPVIHLINDRNRGLMNGSVGTIVDFVNSKPIVMFKDGDSFSEHIIEKHVWEKVENNILIRMEQYPLLLAYAITIHRSQGQTLSQASIVLDSRVWERSQSYVALSRLQSLKGLCLLEFDTSIFSKFNKNDRKVKIFYKRFI